MSIQMLEFYQICQTQKQVLIKPVAICFLTNEDNIIYRVVDVVVVTRVGSVINCVRPVRFSIYVKGFDARDSSNT